MFTLLIDLALALVAALMLLKGHYAITRQMATVPLVVALVDATFAAQLQLSLTPVISALLVVLQIAILMVSGGILREDMARARQKRARRQQHEAQSRRQTVLHQATPHHEQMRRAA